MKSITSLLIVSLALFYSCTSGFGDIADDPYKMKVVPPKTLMTPIIYEGHWALNNKSWKINGDLMQYSVQTNGYEAIHQYVVKDADVEYLWTNLYRRANDANQMCIMAEQQNDNTALAIGLTLRAWLVSNITDIFGDVPYSDAFKGITDMHFKSKFDSQKDIYLSLLSDLERANELFDTKIFSEEVVDILYNGDPMLWRKFTNSLRVRLLMRLSNQTEIDIRTLLNVIVNNPSKHPVFSGIKDAAVLRYTGVSPFANKFNSWKENEFSSIKRICSTLTEQMNNTQDPRRDVYMTISGNGYAGVKSGYDSDAIAEMVDNDGYGTSMFSPNLRSSTCPFAIMNYSELKFAFAEAAQRGLINANAESLYNEAVRSAVLEWKPELDETKMAAFLKNKNVVYDGTIERIMQQKWVSFYFCGFDSWYEYRRTGLPNMPKGPALKNEGVLPTRFPFPSIVMSVNNDNCQEAINRMGGNNNMRTKVWWNK